MFIRTPELTPKGKNIVLVPNSLTTISGYFEGPLENKPYYFGIACYWKTFEQNKPITAFGYFSLVTYLPGHNASLYAMPNGDTEFWKTGLPDYEDFKELGYTGEERHGVKPTFELTHKIGKRTPYINLSYANRFFPKLEKFYNAEIHEQLHTNPNLLLPDSLDGWYKWSDKVLPVFANQNR